MPIAELFLGALLQVLFDRLASRVLLEFSTRKGIRSRLQKLEGNLRKFTEVITHAENRVFRDAAVDEWLEDLRDWAYDADDLLDEVNTRAMQEEEARHNNTITPSWHAFKPSKVRVFLNRCGFLSRRDLVLGINSGMHSNVDKLNSRLETISERMDEMRGRIMEMTASRYTSTPLAILPRPLEAPAAEFDPRVFGREQEKERIIQQLRNSRDASVEVIPIVGMPGVGKTTLARHVFDSVSVQRQQPPVFDLEAWVCVSDDFDVHRITRDILDSFTSGASDLRTLNQLQSKLKEVVGGKKFLLVLDDVWTRDYYNHWKPLRSPLGEGAPGSKILVTTRDDKVAAMMQTDDPTKMKIHQLETLCDDDCWSVFLQHVIDNIYPNFESGAVRFRKTILGKCNGLPLAATLLAGLLRGESPGQGWEAKLKSSIWDLSEDELLYSGKGHRMLPVVMLSYFHLPLQLKRCFSYCAVLPEDYEFEEEEIVSLWMAHGLFSPGRGGELPEVTCATYFRELVSRSLFQRSPKNSSRFCMHDLIHDMAEIVAGKSCFKLDGERNIDSIPEKVRYSSYSNFNGLKKEFEVFERTKYLRDLQSFDLQSFDCWSSVYDLTSYVPLQLLMKLKYVRVLCLRGYSVRELPKHIGGLIHLRLVDFSHTYIKKLPESTSSLYNLQTLKLKWCRRLRTLPTQMSKLVNLKNLDCLGENKLVAMPVGMDKLTSLQQLSNFIVGKGLGKGVGQLKDLSNLNLKGSISISFLENVQDSKDAREARLMSKEGLQSVELKWNSDNGVLHGTGISSQVIQELQPHKHLEELIINGYGGLSFPSWVGNDEFSKMKVIKLVNCEKCTSLPPLGKLPILEEIEIRNMGGIKCVGEEFYGRERGAFPSLKILTFEYMENWSSWRYAAGGGCHFARLEELRVISCPKLSMSLLPDAVNVQKLTVRKCDKLLVALPRQSISKMYIGECKVELTGCLKEDGGDASQLLPSVTRLTMEKVDVVEAVGSARMGMNIIISNKEVAEAHRQMMMLGSLAALEIASIPKLTHLPGVVIQGLPKLKELWIRKCEELTSLWEIDVEEMEGLILEKEKSHFLNSLRVLEVRECCQLVCLVPQRGEKDDTDIISEEKEEGKQTQYLGLPCGLEILRLEKCEKLEKLPSDLHNLTSLLSLSIWDCRRLSCLPEMGFPSTLEDLDIRRCELLTCISISASSSSSAMGIGGNGMPLPHSLRSLNILDCENLESVAVDSFPSLESVGIGKCPKLKSLPEGIITHRRLKDLWIVNCHNLGELSVSVHHLTALESLTISGWPAGLPASLRALDITGGAADPITPSPSSSLTTQCTRALSSIVGGAGGPMTSTNEEQLCSVPLPPSLTFLTIRNFKKLSPEAFQNLTSLQYLFISYCPGLTSIPDQLLPPSLRSLEISYCPLLAPQLAKGKGRYWPKVKFIPEVSIDYRSIFDQEE